MSELVRWYLEVALLVVVCFALGAGAMALLLRMVLPEAPPEHTRADGPTSSIGGSA